MILRIFYERYIVNKQKNQSGFAHLMIITVVITIALVGALGYIFYENFINKNTTTNKDSTSQKQTKSTNTPVVAKKIEYKTYTTDKNNISFQYPSTWSVVESRSGDNSFYERSVAINNDSGLPIAEFDVGMQLGGTCETGTQYNTLESVATKYISNTYTDSGTRANGPVTLSYTIMKNTDGTYGVHYGLSDYYTKLGTGTVCSNTFYYNFEPNIDGVNGMAFGNSVTGTRSFSSLDAANQYLKSDEYGQIKKMILTLNY